MYVREDAAMLMMVWALLKDISQENWTVGAKMTPSQQGPWNTCYLLNAQNGMSHFLVNVTVLCTVE